MTLWAYLVAKVGKVVAWLIVGFVAFTVLWGIMQVKSCRDSRAVETQAKITTGQLGAFQNSAADSTNTISNVNENAMGRAEQARRDTEEIDNAQGAHDPINPDVYAAGLRAHCRRAASADDPKCRLLNAHTP